MTQTWKQPDALQIVLARIPDRYGYGIADTPPDPDGEAVYMLSVWDAATYEEVLDIEGPKAHIVSRLVQWLDTVRGGKE